MQPLWPSTQWICHRRFIPLKRWARPPARAQNGREGDEYAFAIKDGLTSAEQLKSATVSCNVVIK